MTDRTYRDALAALSARHDGDIPPEQATALDLGSGLPAWGWDREESDLTPFEDGQPFRGIVIGVIGGIVLWTVLLWGLSIAAGWRPWRGWF